jgi:hypothetical protein
MASGDTSDEGSVQEPAELWRDIEKPFVLVIIVDLQTLDDIVGKRNLASAPMTGHRHREVLDKFFSSDGYSQMS